MHFAVVIAPPRVNATSVDRVEALRARLMKGGLNVLSVGTKPSLARDLSRVLDAMDEGDSLLVYLACELRMTGETQIALALARNASAEDGDAWLGLGGLGEVLRARAMKETLLIVDGHFEGDAGDAMTAVEYADAAVHALGAREQGLEVLIGIHAGSEPHWPFTNFLTRALEASDVQDERGATVASRVYARIKDHPELASSLPAFAHVRGAIDFEILPAPEPPPPSRSDPPAQRTSSLPPLPSLRAPRTRSVVPLPAIEPIMEAADRAQAKGRWAEAHDGYKKALMILGEGDGAVRASLYASIGEVKLGQGKPREAETNFEKALVADAKHKRALEALVKLAIESQDWTRAVVHQKKLAASLEGAAQVDALVALAELYQVRAADANAAAAALEQARAIDASGTVLQRLRGIYEGLEQWTKLAQILADLAARAESPIARADLLFQEAEVALGHAFDDARAMKLLEEALEHDPTHDRALGALVALRGRRHEWRELDRNYAHLIDRFAAADDSARAGEMCKRLARLRVDKLHDGPGAIDALEGALRCEPSDIATRATLADLLAAKGDDAAAATELAKVAHQEPTRAATYERLFEIHRRGGRTDRAWLAAQALEELHATHVDHDMLLEQFRPQGNVRPNASLDDAAWDALLRAPGSDSVVAAVMHAIAPAAVAMRVEELRAQRQLVMLDPLKKQPPTSTASVVRAFGFASQVLGVASPSLFVMDDDKLTELGGLAAAQVIEPSTLIGAQVSSGRSLGELSFLVARHLAYYRPEHYVLVFFPTLNELTALFLAAVKLAMPAMPLPTHSAAAAAKLRKELDAHATRGIKEELAVALEELDKRDGKVDLTAWIRSVELTATRAGLLMCGDLGVALSVMKAESRAIAELTYDAKRGDLLAFLASNELAELRARIGISARSSARPPA